MFTAIFQGKSVSAKLLDKLINKKNLTEGTENRILYSAYLIWSGPANRLEGVVKKADG